MIWVVVVGFFAGIISGMGIGGGTILIPALIFMLDLNQHQVQGINLLYFIPTAIIALVIHNKNENVLWTKTKPIAMYGLLGAIGGAFLAISLDPTLLKKLFGGFLFLMGLREIFTKKEEENYGKK